jgi:hypothetical protein
MNGWQRRIRHNAFNPPRTTPNLSIASIAYSEHVGVKRHAGGNIGEIAHL